jgi:hypothetical protein
VVQLVIGVAPSLKLTVPVGVAVDPNTVDVSVVVAPTAVGLGAAASAIEEGPAETTRAKLDEVEVV